jgi:hypothetical protein
MKRPIAITILNTAATLVALGGCFDMLLPAPPANLVAYLGISGSTVSPQLSALLLGLLRALGGSLFAIGVTALVIINGPLKRGERWACWTLLILIGISEGVNASQMWRFGSPFYFPLAFVALTAVGVVGINTRSSSSRH